MCTFLVKLKSVVPGYEVTAGGGLHQKGDQFPAITL
jgi:hypothetical protein